MPYKSREWGSNTWHKFGKYAEHLLKNSWKENKDSYYNNYMECNYMECLYEL